jgi:hypothetical protein
MFEWESGTDALVLPNAFRGGNQSAWEFHPTKLKKPNARGEDDMISSWSQRFDPNPRSWKIERLDQFNQDGLYGRAEPLQSPERVVLAPLGALPAPV